MSTCIFCEIVSGRELAHVIWEDERFLALLDIHPYREGHVLLLPKKHMKSIYELPEPFYSDFFRAAKQLFEPLKSAMNLDEVWVILETVNETRHLRIHLIPANREDEVNLDKRLGINSEQLAGIANRIRVEVVSRNLGPLVN